MFVPANTHIICLCWRPALDQKVEHCLASRSWLQHIEWNTFGIGAKKVVHHMGYSCQWCFWVEAYNAVDKLLVFGKS